MAQSITKKYQILELGKSNKKVVFLLAGWYNKLWMFWIFSKILALNGYFCITYAYDGDVFSSDTTKTNKYMNEISEEILLKIKQLKSSGYEEFSVFGTSLGSVIALIVVNKSPDVSRVILNTTGIDLAEVVWGWDTINPSFKDGLTNQNLTKNKLREIWREITPANNINNLKNKKILIYLSEKDEVIPYSLGLKLINEFEKRHYSYRVIINKRLKHLYTGVYNLFNSKEYINFLKN